MNLSIKFWVVNISPYFNVFLTFARLMENDMITEQMRKILA